MCLLFDTIETKQEATAYIGSFLADIALGQVSRNISENRRVCTHDL